MARQVGLCVELAVKNGFEGLPIGLEAQDLVLLEEASGPHCKQIPSNPGVGTTGFELSLDGLCFLLQPRMLKLQPLVVVHGVYKVCGQLWCCKLGHSVELEECTTNVV